MSKKRYFATTFNKDTKNNHEKQQEYFVKYNVLTTSKARLYLLAVVFQHHLRVLQALDWTEIKVKKIEN